MSKIYILCWGTNMDDEPFQMMHHTYYSSMNIALEAMDNLIKAYINVDCYAAIAMDREYNQLISIVERNLDDTSFAPIFYEDYENLED